ncbi:hypothetical protein [Frankia sp. Cj3]|uniref:hypothetical protein n=1 Tax=Frankia sp. Cj3 TaxID=2880976 RepID=UPI001EF49B7A|nr:hypothetical protein [Frankia sp. Cj3]
MVALRSQRADRVPLVAVWVLALAALGVGITAVSPILIVWGVLGVAGSAFATRIHLRDTGPRRSADTAMPNPAEDRPSAPSDPSGEADPVEQEHLR